MTYTEAQHWSYELARAIPHLQTQVAPGAGHGWEVVVCEGGSDEWITLPDAASCAAYRDARRGSVPQSGAPDFGAGGL